MSFPAHVLVGVFLVPASTLPSKTKCVAFQEREKVVPRHAVYEIHAMTKKENMGWYRNSSVLEILKAERARYSWIVHMHLSVVVILLPCREPELVPSITPFFSLLSMCSEMRGGRLLVTTFYDSQWSSHLYTSLVAVNYFWSPQPFHGGFQSRPLAKRSLFSTDTGRISFFLCGSNPPPSPPPRPRASSHVSWQKKLCRGNLVHRVAKPTISAEDYPMILSIPCDAGTYCFLLSHRFHDSFFLLDLFFFFFPPCFFLRRVGGSWNWSMTWAVLFMKCSEFFSP